MALSAEEKYRRRNDERVKEIASRICRKDTGKPYVFISYKSDAWEKVLGDIVYRLVMDYGLNIYFDADFNRCNPLWIKQFPDNMDTENCKGIIAFVDDAYATSYATLMELMYSQVGCEDRKQVVTVDLGELTNINDVGDTGLGVQVYEDGSVNTGANEEIKLFKYMIDRLKYKQDDIGEILIDPKLVYKYNNSNKLIKALCSKMLIEVLKSTNTNRNYINKGIELDDIVSTIKNACGEEVFSSLDKNQIKKNDNEKNHDKEPVNTVCTDNTAKAIAGGKDRTVTKATSNEFQYTLWNVPHSSKNLKNFMTDVFDLIAEKYPDKVPEIAASTDITSVARKDDKAKIEKYTYFRNSIDRSVKDIMYCVGASYGRKEGIKQLEKMLSLCGENKNELKITAAPPIKPRSSQSNVEKEALEEEKNKKKEGLGELL